MTGSGAIGFDPNDQDSWYFGRLSRDEAENILRREDMGIFLVRDSTSIKGDFVLCVKEEGKISHYIINKISVAGEPERFKIGKRDFYDLSSLLAFYKEHILDTSALLAPAKRRQTGQKSPAVGSSQSPKLSHNAPLNITPQNSPKSARNIAIQGGAQVCTAPLTQGVASLNISPGPRGSPPVGLNAGQISPQIPRNVTPEPDVLDSTAADAVDEEATREKVIAKFEFKKRDPEDLPFDKGDVLTVVRKDEDQWWTARNEKGETGLIPANYVTKFDPNVHQVGPTPPFMSPPLSPPFQQSMPQVSPTSAASPQPMSPQNEQIRPNYPEIPIGLPTISGERPLPSFATVIKKREPSPYDKTQLKLDVGEIVEITAFNKTGEWEGRVNGKIGFFPFTHVKLIDEKPDSAS